MHSEACKLFVDIASDVQRPDDGSRRVRSCGGGSHDGGGEVGGEKATENGEFDQEPTHQSYPSCDSEKGLN